MLRMRLLQGLAAMLLMRATVAAPAAETTPNLPPEAAGFLWIPDLQRARTVWSSQDPARLWASARMDSLRAAFERNARTNLLAPLQATLGFNPFALLELGTGDLLAGWITNQSAPWNLSVFLSFESGTNTAAVASLLRQAATPTSGTQDADAFSIQVRRQDWDRLVAPAGSGAPGAIRPPGSNETLQLRFQRSGTRWVGASDAATLEHLASREATNGIRPPNPTWARLGDLVTPEALVLAAWPARAGPDTANTATPAASTSSPVRGRLLEALGFGSLDSVALALHAGRSGWGLDVRLRIPEPARKGIFRLVSAPGGDLGPPGFLPATTQGYLRARIPAAHAWSTLEQTLRDFDTSMLGIFQLLVGYAGRTEDPDFDLEKRVIARLGDDWILADVGLADTPSRTAPVLAAASSRPEDLVEALRLVAAPSYLTTFLPPESPPPRREDHAIHGRRLVTIAFPAIPGLETQPGSVHFTAARGHVLFSTDRRLLERLVSSTNRLPAAPGALAPIPGDSTGVLLHVTDDRTLMRALFASLAGGPEQGSGVGGLIWGALPPLLKHGLAGMQDWMDPATLPPFTEVAHHFGQRVDRIGVSDSEIRITSFRPRQPPRDQASAP